MVFFFFFDVFDIFLLRIRIGKIVDLGDWVLIYVIKRLIVKIDDILCNCFGIVFYYVGCILGNL